jgi:anti-sigma regulatory factor (Ser/Thr protein kinase)
LVEIDAELSSDCVFITVRDFGAWRAPRGENRGRGLPLIEAVMDSVDVAKGPRGTEVRMIRRLEKIDGAA